MNSTGCVCKVFSIFTSWNVTQKSFIYALVKQMFGVKYKVYNNTKEAELGI